jgi:hypothetical protein
MKHRHQVPRVTRLDSALLLGQFGHRGRTTGTAPMPPDSDIKDLKQKVARDRYRLSVNQ